MNKSTVLSSASSGFRHELAHNIAAPAGVAGDVVTVVLVRWSRHGHEVWWSHHHGVDNGRIHHQRLRVDMSELTVWILTTAGLVELAHCATLLRTHFILISEIEFGYM